MSAAEILQSRLLSGLPRECTVGFGDFCELIDITSLDVVSVEQVRTPRGGSPTLTKDLNGKPGSQVTCLQLLAYRETLLSLSDRELEIQDLDGTPHMMRQAASKVARELARCRSSGSTASVQRALISLSAGESTIKYHACTDCLQEPIPGSCQGVENPHGPVGMLYECLCKYKAGRVV